MIIESTTERILFGRGGHIATVADSQKILDNDLPGNFAKLRAALKPLVGGDLSRVVFVSYGNPALPPRQRPAPAAATASTCIRRSRPIAAAPAPGLRFRRRAIPAEDQGAGAVRGAACCRDAEDRPHDASSMPIRPHSPITASASASSDDPEFDREMLLARRQQLRHQSARRPRPTRWPADGRASEFRPYAPRARWIRTANDSYFTAMTYPQGLSSMLQPSNIHDATWGIMSAVYGGAIHPTAEGHAAMADAALPAVRAVLGAAGAGESPVRAEPLPPPSNVNAPPRACALAQAHRFMRMCQSPGSAET